MSIVCNSLIVNKDQWKINEDQAFEVTELPPILRNLCLNESIKDAATISTRIV